MESKRTSTDGKDSDEKSFQYATENILANDLKSRIRPLKTNQSGPLIPLDDLGIKKYDFWLL